jgi:PAS domain S-box-containing protein
MACRALGTDMALVTMIDEAGNWQRAQVGLSAAELKHAYAACNMVMASSGVSVVLDTRLDRRLAEASDAATEQLPRFYAGAAITDVTGYRIGAVCVLDRRPRRHLAAEQGETLQDLAALAGDLVACGCGQRRSGKTANSHIDDPVLARLRLLTEALDAAADGVLITEAGPQGPRIVYANDGFTRQTGYSLARLAGRNLAALQAEADAGEPITELFQPLLDDSAGHHSLCLRYRRSAAPASAEEAWAEIDVTPLANGMGKITNWISILRDVSVRKAAEREAREHAASFRLMFEDNPLPMLLYDPADFSIAAINDSALRTYGYSQAEFLQRTLLDLMPVEDLEEVRQYISQIDDGPASSAWTHVRAGGERIRVQVHSHALTFNGRRMRLAVFWDVTEIELARDALRQSNKELLVLAAQLQARTADLMEVNRRARLGMWRFPNDGGPADWSNEMFEIFGRPPQNPGPDLATALDWIAEGDRKRVRELVTRAVEQRAPQSFEFRAVQPNGETRYCLADLQPQFAPNGIVVAFTGFCQDITERKQTELALLRSEKLKTIGEFTGGVAHDFNNLLTVMMLNVEEAIDALPTDDPLQPLLAPVLHAAMRGSELTSHLVSYARRSPLEPMQISLQSMFNGLKPLLDRILGDRFSLDVRYGDAVVQPFVDAAKLENAILNLVINARDAMASGGTITISTDVVTLGPEDGVAWQDFTPGEYAVISVADTGYGIPPDALPRVFEPFFTTKAAGKGSGLGLSMVYGFARQSGGHIALASEVGRGTVATLYLPVHGAPHAWAARATKPASQRVTPRLIALLVEDQPEVLTTVKRQLLTLGFRVLVAADASRAMDILTGTPLIDLLFSDVAIPGPVDGTQLADIARQHHPEIRILLTSGYLEDTAALPPHLARATEFLQKPYSRADLAAHLAAMFPIEELGEPEDL